MRFGLCLVHLGVLIFATVSLNAQEIRLSGATTFIDRIITPYKAAVEKATGFTLTVIGNNTGRGLADLVDGKSDASLASEPIPIAVEAAKVAGKVIDPAKLVFHLVMNDEIVFVVHKNNPVRRLTWQQIRDIHTGKITNWKQVGGKDIAIVVFTDSLTGGTRAMIKHVVLEGQEYGPDSKPQTAVRRVGEQVAVTENGFGGLGKGFVDSDDLVIVETAKLERPLGFITLGAANESIARVIAAFRAQVKK